MKKSTFTIIYSFLLIIIFSTPLLSQNTDSTSVNWDKLPRLKTLPQEKLYLHFDKPYYVAGDRMWFRAYLVNADTHKTDTASCAIYVELINSKDSLIQRIKIRNNKGVYTGGILLDETTPEGTYSVRAYTNWMRNAGSDFFYFRQFYVGNSITSQIQSSIKYTFYNDKKVGADIYFKQKDGPLASKKINYYFNLKGQPKSVKSLTTTANGFIHIEYNPLQIEAKKPFIYLSYLEGQSKYERSYILPAKETEYDVQFFPEGGSLVAGTSNGVAFKAIQSDGLSTDITGNLFDDKDVKVCDFKSTHLGMGKFYFLPDSTKKYYALIENKGGEKKRFELPPVKQNTYLLTASIRNKKIFIAIKSDISVQGSDSLILLGHSRGTVFFKSSVTSSKTLYTFNENELRPGILSFLLINKKGEALSERLVFVKPDKMPNISLNFDKKAYEAREKVTCAVKVVDSKGNPIQGSFSVAATDANDVQLDKSAENIINALLLSSDLKGYIEKPNDYFDPTNKQADEDLDILMMTQGWKRFDVEKILRGKQEKAENYLEEGQAISGRVAAGLLNKMKKGTIVTILAPSIRYFGTTETDDKGRFIFSRFQFPDSTKFTIHAKQKKGLKDAVEIYLDQDTFPQIQEHIVPPENTIAVNESQLESANQKYIYENGVFNQTLKELVVTEKAVEPEELITDPDYLFSYEDYSLSKADLDRYSKMPFSSLLHAIPDLSTWSEYPVNNDAQIYSDDNGMDDSDPGPHFAWNGNIYTYQEVQGLNVEDLQNLKVLRTMAPGGKKSLDNILIVLEFKNNKTLFSQSMPQNIVTIMPLGYAKNVVFYQPKYDVESVHNSLTPDWRSTICWQPELKTDASGTGTFWFYTADRTSAYNIVIEGISPKGEACRIESKQLFFNKNK